MPIDVISDELLLLVVLAPVLCRERCGEIRRKESLVSRAWNGVACFALTSSALGIHNVRFCGMIGLRIPRSPLPVPPIAVLGLDDPTEQRQRVDEECQTHLIDTFTETIGGLYVSAAFRAAGINEGEEYWTEEDRLSYENRILCDSIERCDELEQGEVYDMVVSLRFVTPLLRAVDDIIDVTVLPSVFREALGLSSCTVLSADYTPGKPIVYKRIVRGPFGTTVREVWNAIGEVEGWDKRTDDDYSFHHGDEEAQDGITVYDWFVNQTPQLKDLNVVYAHVFGRDQLLEDFEEESTAYYMDGGDTLHFTWPACEHGRRQSTDNNHFHVRWVNRWL